jgi:hypothetical protein
LQTHLEGRSKVHEIIDNEASVTIIPNRDTAFDGNQFPGAVHIVHEVNECLYTIGRAKRHDPPSPFDSVRALKGKLHLRLKGNFELMVTLQGIHNPKEN